MAKIKFMGSSDEHRLLAGDDFGGRLSEGIPQDVTFNRKNNWVVDSEEVGLSDAAVQVLDETPDFKNVSGLDRIPLNRNQSIFLGMKEGTVAPVVAEASTDVDDPAEQAKREAVEAERIRLEEEEAKRAAATTPKPKK